MNRWTLKTLAVVLATLGLLRGPASAQVPAAISENAATIVAIYHAEGAQIYECRLGADRKLSWQFREPIATLISEGATVGRHYAGPHWELIDGSLVSGKVVGTAPGTTPDDIPWLKLTVATNRGTGKLAQVDVVQRINTHGGVAAGPCDDAGMFRTVPYSADYSFLRKD